MSTVYLIPVGTQGTIAVPGHEPKPHFARRQLQFTTPPELTTHSATFNFAKCRLTVPREAVIVSDRGGLGVWKRIDT
jgi:hypothetical protein